MKERYNVMRSLLSLSVPFRLKSHLNKGPDRSMSVRNARRALAIRLDAFLTLWLLLQFGPAMNCFAQPVSVQAETVSAAVLSFQDESGARAPNEFCWKLSGYLMKELSIISNKNVIPRGVRLKPDAVRTAETLNVLGQKLGVQFVIHTGLLALNSESSAGIITTRAQLYADVLSLQTLKSKRLEAGGVGTWKGKDADAVIRWDSADFGSSEFFNSSFGRALRSSIEQLATLIYQELQSGSSEEAAPREQPRGIAEGGTRGLQKPETLQPESDDTEEDPEATEETEAADADEELQQLIGQAEEALSNSPNLSSGKVDSLRQTLERLVSALQRKSRLLEEGDVNETDQADQQIEVHKEELQESLEQIPQEDSGESEASGRSPEKQSAFDRVTKYVDLALSVVQRIQEMRSGFRRVQEEYSGSAESSSEDTEESEASEESLGEVSGVVTEDGQPVEGAVVSDPDSGASATTDNSGSYILGAVPPKLTKLLVKKGGRAAEGRVDVVRGRSTTADFELTPKAGLRAGAALGARVLPSTVVVDSRIRSGSAGTLKGLVQDAQGRPVQRALVELKGLAVARTNSKGLYTFAKVPAGFHQLTALKTGLRSQSERVKVEPRKTNESTIRLAVDNMRNRQGGGGIFLRGAAPSNTAVFRGLITDNQSRPVAGAKVFLSGSSKGASIRTRRNGGYELRDLRPGTYRVLISKIGFAETRQTISLGAGRTEQRSFQLTPAASQFERNIFSKVVTKLGEIRGQIRGNRGSIPNARVELKRIAGKSARSSAKTSSKGDYVLRAPAGRYELKVRAKDFQETSERVTVQSGGSTTRNFELRPSAERRLGSDRGTKQGEQASRGRMERDEQTGRKAGKTIPGGIFSDEGRRGLGAGQARREGILTGWVRDKSSGRPIAEAVVSISGQGTDRTDRNGNYTISNLAPGKYQVRVTKGNYFNDDDRVSIGPGARTTKDFDLRPRKTEIQPDDYPIGFPGKGRSKRKDVHEAEDRAARVADGQLRGRVTDDRTGKPIPGALVSIQRHVDTTDRDGGYRIGNLEPGNHRVSVSKTGYSREDQNVTIRAGQTSSAHFRLSSRSFR